SNAGCHARPSGSLVRTDAQPKEPSMRALILISAIALSASAAPPDPADGVSAMQADVYVSNGNGGLITPSFQTTPLDVQLFAASGASLSVTWGQWIAATATSSVHCAGGKTRAK